jgi:hypothetical protein
MTDELCRGNVIGDEGGPAPWFVLKSMYRLRLAEMPERFRTIATQTSADEVHTLEIARLVKTDGRAEPVRFLI